MIIIEKGDKTRLPKEYHGINNICAYLYDQLTEVLDDPIYANMGNSDVIFGDDDKLREAFNNTDEYALDILRKAGRNSDIETIVTKHVVMSIIADMVNFVYESIVIVQKCKISVAYALLRKPFTDQLLILEQILSDRTDFVNRYFFDGDPKKYDPSARGLNKRMIIENSFRKIEEFTAFDANLIYQMRYDKSCEYGISVFANYALHIVTTDKNYQTENQGLNFTFPLADEDIDEYLHHYYYNVATLLIYTASVVDKIVFDFIENKDGRKEEKIFRRLLTGVVLYDDEKRLNSKGMFSLFSRMLKSKCAICKHVNKFTKRDFLEYLSEYSFICKKCFNPVKLSEETLEIIAGSLRRNPLDPNQSPS